MHFTRMGGYGGGQDVPIIVRGDGCYLWDSNGKRYLDALAGLFSVNVGYGYGEEIGQAALEQMRELPFYTNWSYAHPARDRARRRGRLARSRRPQPRLLRLRRLRGGRVGLEAGAPVLRCARREAGSDGRCESRSGATTRSSRRGGGPHRYKAIARHIAYHGTTMGALSINGIPALRSAFEPLVPEVRHVHNTNRYHRPARARPRRSSPRFLLDDLEQAILAMGPETVCLVHMEPVQNAGGCFTPPAGYWQGVRALCDEYDILLSADEVITGFGRLGYWFGSERYDIRPDIVTCAKGLSSSYGPIGAVLARDAVMEPFLDSTSMYSHGITFGGHPVMCAIALKNIEIMKREGDRRARPRHRGRVPREAGDAARPADRRRRARHRLLLRDRARQGQGDARQLRRRRVRDAAARLPLAAPLRGRSDLPPGRPRRPGRPDLAAARRGRGGDGRDRRASSARCSPRPRACSTAFGARDQLRCSARGPIRLTGSSTDNPITRSSRCFGHAAR